MRGDGMVWYGMVWETLTFSLAAEKSNCAAAVEVPSAYSHSAVSEVPSRRSSVSASEVYLSRWKFEKPLCAVFRISTDLTPDRTVTAAATEGRPRGCCWVRVTCVQFFCGPTRLKEWLWGAGRPDESTPGRRSQMSCRISMLMLLTICGYSFRKCFPRRMPKSSIDSNALFAATQYTVFLHVSVATTIPLFPPIYTDSELRSRLVQFNYFYQRTTMSTCSKIRMKEAYLSLLESTGSKFSSKTFTLSCSTKCLFGLLLSPAYTEKQTSKRTESND